MTHAGYSSVSQLISDVLRLTDDIGFRDLSEGEYESLARQAITNLGYDTYFDERAAVIELNGCLDHDLPPGMFNIVHVWAFSGDRCTPGSRANVFHATGYYRDRKLQLKEQNGGQRDLKENVASQCDINATLFYNTLGGRIMLSDAVAAYPRLLIEYRGIGGSFNESPTIPYHLYDAVKWWVAHEALGALALMRKDQATDRALDRANKALYGDGRISNPGAWLNARRRVQSSDEKEMRDTAMYLRTLGNTSV